MQTLHTIRELNDQELKTVVGGTLSSTHTDAQVSVQASAQGGHFHIDTVTAKTTSVSITTHGESASSAVGFTLALAL